jgi:hypothetical protein
MLSLTIAQKKNKVGEQLPKFHEMSGKQYSFRCPACKCGHVVSVEGSQPVWTWNGSVEAPTLSPSIRVSWTWINDDGKKVDKCCHSFIKEGNIQFLNDCTHDLAGQTVDLPEWE